MTMHIIVFRKGESKIKVHKTEILFGTVYNERLNLLTNTRTPLLTLKT